MNTETHKERAEKLISMLVWLDGLPLHRRASLRDMIEAGMMEAVAYEQERNQNNVAAADLELKEMKLQIERLQNALREIAAEAEKHSGWWSRTTAQHALDRVTEKRTEPWTEDQKKALANVADSMLSKIEKRNDVVPPVPSLDGPEPTLYPEDEAALDAIKCKRCGLHGLRCVFCTPPSSSTCGH
jgi:hypothetical protein